MLWEGRDWRGALTGRWGDNTEGESAGDAEAELPGVLGERRAFSSALLFTPFGAPNTHSLSLTLQGENFLAVLGETPRSVVSALNDHSASHIPARISPLE